MRPIYFFRRLWQHVTEALRQKDIEKATEHKRILEERQRTEERHRAETETPWRTRYFDREVSLNRLRIPIVIVSLERAASNQISLTYWPRLIKP